MNRIFTKHIVYPVFWMSRGIPALKYLPEYFANENLSSDELYSLQWKNLKSLLKHAYSNVPFYRKMMNNLGCNPMDILSLEDFAKLPCLTKDDIIEHKDDLIATNFDITGLVRDSTGGSTGKNINFYEDKNELGHRFAATIRSDSWAGLDIGKKYAQIWGSPLDIDKTSFIRKIMDRFLLQRLFISSFRLSEEALQNAISRIKHFKPEVLIGYPTPLCRLSQYLAKNDLGNLGIRCIISSAETLYPNQRQEIENQFKCKVFDRYGCREFGPIAVECEAHQGLHILTDRFIVEFMETPMWAGSNETPLIPRFTKGHENTHKEFSDGIREFIITDLHKYGMPFIRYRIGDLGIPSNKSCPCGRKFPLLDRVEGRTFDLVIGTNGNVVAGTFWTLLFRRVENIRCFQVIQRKRDTLHINLNVTDKFDKSSLAWFEKEIKGKCGNDMHIQFDLVPMIEPGIGGKFRFIISDVSKKELC